MVDGNRGKILACHGCTTTIPTLHYFSYNFVKQVGFLGSDLDNVCDLKLFFSFFITKR